MKLSTLLLRSLVNIFAYSPNPNLFGSQKKIAAKNRIASEMKDLANETGAEIDLLKSQNPFESAASKSAMTASARSAKQIAQRHANMMGAGASPEAIIAAQSATQNAISGTAGQIATGAEANQQAQIAGLRGERAQQMSGAFQAEQMAADEIGSGWDNAFKAISSLGSAAGAVASFSDERLKENIIYIGKLQGHKIYKYNFIGSRESHIGVLAQEIQKYKPEMVDESGEFLKVFYNRLFTQK